MVEVNQWNLRPIQRAPDPSAGSGIDDGTLSVEVINSCNRYLNLCLYFIFDLYFAHLNDDYILSLQREIIRYEAGSGHQNNTLREIQFAGEKLDQLRIVLTD